MEHNFMIIEETMVVDVDEIEKKIIKVKENLLIILTKEILHTIRSGTTLRQNKMKTKVYRINLQRIMEINVTDVV
jgi:hypothetical protein